MKLEVYDTILCTKCRAEFDITVHEIRRSFFGREYVYCHNCGAKLRLI